MELIDKAVALRTLRFSYRDCKKDAEETGGEAVLLAEGLSDAIDIISDVPVVRDVAPVVHGRWIFDSGDEYADHYHCDQCGAKIDLCNELYTEPFPNYCKDCGAKMDGGGDDGLETP